MPVFGDGGIGVRREEPAAYFAFANGFGLLPDFANGFGLLLPAFGGIPFFAKGAGCFDVGFGAPRALPGGSLPAGDLLLLNWGGSIFISLCERTGGALTGHCATIVLDRHGLLAALYERRERCALLVG
jgi:hypothetical protein